MKVDRLGREEEGDIWGRGRGRMEGENMCRYSLQRVRQTAEWLLQS